MRERRVLGQELITFCDGDTREVKMHSVPHFKRQQLRRLNRVQILDKKGGIEKVDFKDEEYTRSVLNLSAGSQMTIEDWEETENDLKKLYDKYFPKELTTEKKVKSADTKEPNLDKESKK